MATTMVASAIMIVVIIAIMPTPFIVVSIMTFPLVVAPTMGPIISLIVVTIAVINRLHMDRAGHIHIMLIGVAVVHVLMAGFAIDIIMMAMVTTADGDGNLRFAVAGNKFIKR